MNEMEGAKLMLELQHLAVKTYEFHRAHGLPTPASLARFLGEDLEPSVGADKSRVGRVTIPPMQSPQAPGNATSSWIWVPESECTAGTLVLAWLSQTTERVTAADVFAALSRIRPNINKGTIANVGTRLDGSKIDRTGEGWKLIKRDTALVLFDGNVWGELEMLEKTEVAFYRRSAVKHVLKAWPGGLQIVQIVDALRESCPWLNRDVPVSKDLIKMDMKELEESGAVKRRGNSGKWEVTDD